MAAFLVTLGVIAFVVLVLRFVVKAHGRIKESTRRAAQLLRLRRVPELGDSLLDDLDTYRGAVDGVDVILRGGARAVRPAGSDTAVPVGMVSVTALLPQPLRFGWQIVAAGAGRRRDVETGDPDFDARCAVAAEEPRGAAEMLDDPSLRAAIAAFLCRKNALAEITQEAVEIRVYEGKLITLLARDAAALARRISERAAELR